MGYTRKQVEEFTGIPARRIQFYTDNNLVSLENPNPGRGRERQYSKKDILQLLMVAELAKHKMELSQIKKLLVERPGLPKKAAKKIFEPSTYEVENPPKIFFIIIGPDEMQYQIWDNPLPPLLSMKEKFPQMHAEIGEDEVGRMILPFLEKEVEFVELMKKMTPIDPDKWPSILILNVTYLGKKLNEL